ncbi:MAG: heterodisulfide reductase-related iron-sulfur binding cluster [Gammaproteobacteria bacterium]
MTRQYLYLPGCAAQPGASASHAQRALDTLCGQLDIHLEAIPDWNCCGATLGQAAAGELPRLALTARNLALAERARPGQDVVIAQAGCWLATRSARDRLCADDERMSETNRALAEAGLKYEAKQQVRHFIEVLLEDIGLDALATRVTRPFSGLRIAGHVGCRVNAIDPESRHKPRFLDQLIKSVGGEPITDFDPATTCCGPTPPLTPTTQINPTPINPTQTNPSQINPPQPQSEAHAILTNARARGADLIVTTCASCQLKLEIEQQGALAEQSSQGTGPNALPVLLYTQMIGLALGADPAAAALDGNLIPATHLFANTGS